VSVRRIPTPACLVVSAIYRDQCVLDAALRPLTRTVGEMRCAGGEFPFDRTDYYRREMGAPLRRRFFVGAATVARDALPAIKLLLEQGERDTTQGGKRVVNLDPGLLTAENFILATGKNYSHRVYLRDGVFADLTLEFRKGDFRPLPWTYPDYASGEVRSLLREIRAGFLAGGTAGGERKCG
jgi:Domain of unknown function (DUF4416)